MEHNDDMSSPRPDEWAIEVSGLTKNFGPRAALSNISLAIPSGSSTILMGPNGAGKSTLLRCIAGLLDFDKGLICVRVRSRVLELTPGDQRGIRGVLGTSIGFVPQDVELWGQYSVLENVWRPQVDILGRSKSDSVARAELWLQRLDVPTDRWLARPYGKSLGGLPTLSGGQHRKVAIARALAMDPEILILDEIEAHLDFQSMGVLIDALQTPTLDDRQRTIVLVTHRAEVSANMSSRIVIMGRGGDVTPLGSYDDAIAAPRRTLGSLAGSLAGQVGDSSLLADRCLLELDRLIEDAVSGGSAEQLGGQICAASLRMLEMIEPDERHVVRLLKTQGHESPVVVVVAATSDASSGNVDDRSDATRVDTGFVMPGTFETGSRSYPRASEMQPLIARVRFANMGSSGSPAACTSSHGAGRWCYWIDTPNSGGAQGSRDWSVVIETTAPRAWQPSVARKFRSVADVARHLRD